MKTVIIEFQYFEDCPNHSIMEKNLISAISGLEDKIEIRKILVENEEAARKINFRGSPTVLINGIDLENVPSVAHASMSCRFYRSGIPSSKVIRKKITDQMT
jgi:hypothetical protein